jgi:hypothetical protein
VPRSARPVFPAALTAAAKSRLCRWNSGFSCRLSLMPRSAEAGCEQLSSAIGRHAPSVSRGR